MEFESKSELELRTNGSDPEVSSDPHVESDNCGNPGEASSGLTDVGQADEAHDANDDATATEPSKELGSPEADSAAPEASNPPGCAASFEGDTTDKISPLSECLFTRTGGRNANSIDIIEAAPDIATSCVECCVPKKTDLPVNGSARMPGSSDCTVNASEECKHSEAPNMKQLLHVLEKTSEKTDAVGTACVAASPKESFLSVEEPKKTEVSSNHEKITGRFSDPVTPALPNETRSVRESPMLQKESENLVVCGIDEYVSDAEDLELLDNNLTTISIHSSSDSEEESETLANRTDSLEVEDIVTSREDKVDCETPKGTTDCSGDCNGSSVEVMSIDDSESGDFIEVDSDDSAILANPPEGFGPKGTVEGQNIASLSGEVSQESVSESEISELDLNRLAKYYKLRLLGLDSREALLKAKHERLVPQTMDPHPDCQLPLEELEKISFLIPEGYQREKFIVETFFGGKEPEEQLKFTLSSAYPKRHPSCKHTWEELKLMSHELPQESSRLKFVVETFYEGKEPALLLKAMFFNDSNKAENIDAATVAVDMDCVSLDSFGNPTIIEEGPVSELPNGKLKCYYVWRNGGFGHDDALSKAHSFEAYSRGHLPHPKCKQSQQELMEMSQPLSRDTVSQDRFLIHTYFGGKDPECTLSYLKSRFGKSDQPSNRKPENVFGATLLDENFTVLESINLSNKELKYYYLWRLRGCKHTTALKKIRKGNEIPPKNRMHPNCKHSEDYLRLISQALKSNLTLWERFLIHTCYGGRDPEDTLRYYVSRFTKGDQSVARRTRTHPVPGIIPLHSPDHPSKQLNDEQLINYYLWISHGWSREEAMIKAKTPGQFPPSERIRSRCSVPLEELEKMSKRLPHEKLRKLFIIETHYGGNDPEEIMGFLLSKAGCSVVTSDRKSPQTTNCMATDNRLGSTYTHELDDPTIIEEGGICDLRNNKLKYYYLWRNRGCSHEEALREAHKSVNNKKKSDKLKDYTGKYPAHPACTLSREELWKMARTLLRDDIFTRRFVIHAYFGGKDPECTVRHFISRLPPEQRLPQEKVQRFLARWSPNIPYDPMRRAGFPSGSLSYGPPSLPQVPTVGLPCGPPDLPQAPTVGLPQAPVPPYTPQTDGVPSYQHGIDYPTVIEEGPICDLPNPILKYYYLWRNRGYSHEDALPLAQKSLNKKKKKKLRDETGKYPAHPRCGLSEEELRKMSEPLSRDTFHHERFFIHTYFGGKDPECTMKYINMRRSQQQQLPHRQPVGFPTIGPYDPPLASSFSSGTSSYGPHQALPPYHQQVAGSSPVAYPACYPPVANACISHPDSQLQTDVMPGAIGYPRYQQPVPGPPNVVSGPHQPYSAVPSLADPPLQASVSHPEYANVGPTRVAYSPHQPQMPIGKPQKQEKPTERDSVAPLFVVPTGYPSECLNESQMDAIENGILDAILEIDDDDKKPSFADSCRSSGRYGVTCDDQFSVSWLHTFLSTYHPWPGASLKLISNHGTVTAYALLPPSRNDDDKKILKFIKNQNKGLNVNMWTVIQRLNNGNCNTCMDLIIDEESAKILEKCSRISYKMGCAEIVISKKSSTPTDSQPLLSPPPPPLISEPSREIQRTSLPHGPGEEKDSWLDWFNSRSEPGGTPSDSRMRSRGRSPPSCYRPNKRSRRDQRQSNSVSPLTPQCIRRSNLRNPSPDKYREPSRDSYSPSAPTIPSPPRYGGKSF